MRVTRVKMKVPKDALKIKMLYPDAKELVEFLQDSHKRKPLPSTILEFARLLVEIGWNEDPLETFPEPDDGDE